MSEEQQSDLGAYNLRSNKKLIDSPAVIGVGESEPTVAKYRPGKRRKVGYCRRRVVSRKKW